MQRQDDFVVAVRRRRGYYCRHMTVRVVRTRKTGIGRLANSAAWDVVLFFWSHSRIIIVIFRASTIRLGIFIVYSVAGWQAQCFFVCVQIAGQAEPSDPAG
jgi:hypothetical protein